MGDDRTIVTAAHLLFYTPAELRPFYRQHLGIRTLPNDPKRLAGLLKISKKTFEKVAGVLFRKDTNLADGSPRQQVKPCKFYLPVRTAGERRWKSQEIDTGSFRDSRFLTTNPAIGPVNLDWLVARLAAPIPGAMPLLLPPKEYIPTAGSYRSITQAGGPARLQLQSEECGIRLSTKGGRQSTATFFSDCDASPGSSGGPLLYFDTRQKRFAIYGFFYGSAERCTAGKGYVTGGGSAGPMVSGELDQQIRQAMQAR